MRLAGFFFDVFQVARRSYRYSLTLQGWQLQEPSLALEPVRDWLRMRLCDGDVQSYFVYWRYAGDEATVCYSIVWIAVTHRERESCSICLRCWEIAALA